MIDPQRRVAFNPQQTKDAVPHCGFCESPEFRAVDLVADGHSFRVLQCAGCNALLGMVPAFAERR